MAFRKKKNTSAPES